ncbi:MAG TPA: GNAT family N-acetyltransferase [Micropepsaceae bacterium]|nr:GNAT family N-acetyltransferase [Micropepsaceae bacterium]
MIRIRHASLEDVRELASLHGACFDDRWSAESFRRLLDRPGAVALLAADKTESESQSFILVQVALDECEILTLGTIDGARRKGLALTLLKTAAKEAHALGAREMFLEVAEDNHGAITLYRRAGFEIVGRRQKYYRRADGTVLDAVMLRATLPLDRGPI